MCNLGNGGTLNSSSQLSRVGNTCYVNHISSIDTTANIPSGNCLQSVQHMEVSTSNPVHFGDSNETTSQSCLLCTISERSSVVFGSTRDDDMIDEPESSFFDDLLHHSERLVMNGDIQSTTQRSDSGNRDCEEDIISFIEFVGTEAMIDRMLTICREYADVFVMEVRPLLLTSLQWNFLLMPIN